MQSMKPHVRCAAVVCATLMLVPATTAGQPTATSFSELRLILRPGDEVLVTDGDGRRTRALIRTVTDTSLEVLGTPRTYFESSVTEVKRVDSVVNGMWIGAALGMTAYVLWCSSTDEGCFWLLAAPGSGLFGALAGGFADYFMRKTVYRAALQKTGAGTITLSPLFTTKGAGVSMNLRFRAGPQSP
jgi:hypothetical protein